MSTLPRFSPVRRLPAAAAAAAAAMLLCASAQAATAPAGKFTATAKVNSLEEAAEQGAQIFNNDTFGTKQTWVPPNAFSNHLMTCAACHSNGGKTEGTTPAGQHLPSLIGAAAKYPKYKAKKHEVYTLERQIVHCVRAGIMGKPPAYDSPEMVDLVVYLTQLSKGATMGQQFK